MEGEFMRCKQILGVYFWVDLFSFMKVWAYADQNVVMNKGKLQSPALSVMSVCPSFWSWAVVDFWWEIGVRGHHLFLIHRKQNHDPLSNMFPIPLLQEVINS